MTKEQKDMMGARIRDVRLQRGISQVELAAVAGMSKAQVNNIEHNKKSASLDSVVALVDALDVSLDYIVRGLRPQMGAWGLIFREDDELEESLWLTE